MDFLPVPKIMNWEWNLSQKYICARKILVTSGCSFTSSTLSINCASSWPGYMRDRCRFEYAEDWSYPGMGNFYISQSIIETVKNKTATEQDQCFVAVMWSGLDRVDVLTPANNQPRLASGSYTSHRSSSLSKAQQTQNSFKYIINTKCFLEERNIPYAFTFYINLLTPPFLPVRDSTHRFIDHLTVSEMCELEELHTLSSTKDCLYDFSFYKKYLDQSADNYHPTEACALDWVDSVWLPAIAQRGLISRS